jgi:hypothetical protein
MKPTNRRVKYWFRGKLWGTIEHGKLELSEESKLFLAKENNRRLTLEAELRRLMGSDSS